MKLKPHDKVACHRCPGPDMWHYYDTTKTYPLDNYDGVGMGGSLWHCPKHHDCDWCLKHSVAARAALRRVPTA